MNTIDLQVLDSVIDWLSNGQGVTLATVARTWGSSPRPAGAWAAIRNDGAIVGSVSGGCIEEDLVRRVREGSLAGGGLPEVVIFGATPEEASRYGLPCGGTLQLVVEPAPDLANLKQLRERIGKGLVTARTVYIPTGKVMLENAARNDPIGWDDRATFLTTIHGPQARLLLIGAGQISSYLAPMAQALGYTVTVCEPREEYHSTWHVPGTNLTTTMPDDVVTAFLADDSTAIIALTHDPKLDDMALIEALRSPAFYVGALGSRRTTEARKARLAQHFGLSETELDRLYGPVGLPIGSKTPPEIAISILAEITAVRHGVILPQHVDTLSSSHNCRMP
jgi:xanthine dehydrogenase accessory factor